MLHIPVQKRKAAAASHPPWRLELQGHLGARAGGNAEQWGPVHAGGSLKRHNYFGKQLAVPEKWNLG